MHVGAYSREVPNEFIEKLKISNEEAIYDKNKLYEFSYKMNITKTDSNQEYPEERKITKENLTKKESSKENTDKDKILNIQNKKIEDIHKKEQKEELKRDWKFNIKDKKEEVKNKVEEKNIFKTEENKF